MSRLPPDFFARACVAQ